MTSIRITQNAWSKIRDIITKSKNEYGFDDIEIFFYNIYYKVWINGEQVDVRESEDQIKEVDVGT